MRNSSSNQQKLKDILTQTNPKELDDMFANIFNDMDKKLVQEQTKIKEAAE